MSRNQLPEREAARHAGVGHGGVGRMGMGATFSFMHDEFFPCKAGRTIYGTHPISIIA